MYHAYYQFFKPEQLFTDHVTAKHENINTRAI